MDSRIIKAPAHGRRRPTDAWITAQSQRGMAFATPEPGKGSPLTPAVYEAQNGVRASSGDEHRDRAERRSYPAGLSTDLSNGFVADRVCVCLRSVLGESLGAGPLRGGAVVARRPHKPQVVGAIPTLATTSCRDEGAAARRPRGNPHPDGSVGRHATSNGQAQRETRRHAGVVQPAPNPTDGGSPSCWPTESVGLRRPMRHGGEPSVPSPLGRQVTGDSGERSATSIGTRLQTGQAGSASSAMTVAVTPLEGGSPSCWPTSSQCEANEGGASRRKSAALARADGQRVDSRPKPEASGASGHPPTLSEDGLRRQASDSASPGRGEPAPTWARNGFDSAGESGPIVPAALDRREKRANPSRKRQRDPRGGFGLRPGCGLTGVDAQGARVARRRHHTSWAARPRRLAAETLTVVEAPHPLAPRAAGCLKSSYARELGHGLSVLDPGSIPGSSTTKRKAA